MRSGSSLKESFGFPGVRKTFLARSANPLNGSINSGASPVSSSAIELTVKSRRAKSPRISFPYSTSGLRESASYCSLRYVVTSTVVSPRFPATVPKAIPVSQTFSAHACRIFLLSCGSAFVVKSKSFPRRPKIASRTGPPTKAKVNPLALNACASELARGARSMRERIANSPAAPNALVTISKVRAVPLLHDPGTWCGQRRH